MLDGVLRWIVQVTGLEPKLLSLTAILIVYAASVYLYAKEKASVSSVMTPAQPELGELASVLARVERGIETVATYLINLENQTHEVKTCPFLPPREVGSPPLSHHSPSPDNGSRMAVPPAEELEEEAYYPVPGIAKTQPGFFDLPVQQESPEIEIQDFPLPIIPRESPESPEEEPPPEVEEPQFQPSPAVRRTLKIVSRKAGRTLP